MRTHVLTAVLFLLPFLAPARESLPLKGNFSLELGTGYQPLHMTLSPSRDVERALAEKGQRADTGSAYDPVISLSGVWHAYPRTEFALTAGISWCHHPLIQYEAFGIDPDGKPRYDTTTGKRIGWKDSTPIASLTLRYRHLWNPDGALVAYSGLGAGFVPQTGIPLLPEVTPIGVRFGGRHFYFFLECTMGPVASLGHGGLGWRF